MGGNGHFDNCWPVNHVTKINNAADVFGLVRIGQGIVGINIGMDDLVAEPGKSSQDVCGHMVKDIFDVLAGGGINDMQRVRP